ncbi:MAG: 5,10-methylenetetrahydromethanopterin reductase [Acidimicrobiaceae bacterium]|nr:5,10-methylenetetrahydromethanopterin reductase [Acidimicrobiaceae bacterium]
MTTTGAVRFGLGFQSDKSPAEYERLAAAGERYGFDVLSVFGDLYFQPPLPALLAMARVTERVLLGPACLNPFTVHPVEIAGQIAALDVASGGRAYLGLARGSWLGELGVDQRDGAQAVAEAAAVVVALLAGRTDGVEGRRFRLPPGARLREQPLRDRVPVLVGTWSPRLSGLAADFADEVKIGGSANPAMVPLMRKWLSARTGPGSHRSDPVGIVMGAVTVVDADGHAARRLARQEVAMYLEVVGGLDRTLTVEPELLSLLGQRLAAGDRAGAGALVPDDLLARFAFAGTPSEVSAQALELLDAGADRIEFGTPHGLTDAAGVALLGSEVLPVLRAELA